MSPSDDVQTLAGSPSSGARAMTQERADPRAGVAIRIGAVWLALVIVWVAGGMLGRALAPHMPFDAWRLIQSVLVGAVGVTIVVAACRVLDRRNLASIGFGTSRADAAALLAGAGLWLGLAAVGIVVGVATGAFSVTVGPPTLAMVGWILLQMLLVFTYEAVPEELALRGYIYTNLRERMPRWLAVVVQAVLFMMWAFALVSVLEYLGGRTAWSISLDRAILFLSFGITLAIVRLWTGSLWGSIGFHWAFQTVMGLLGLDRLTVLRIPREGLESAGVILWFFAIVLGGVVALVGLVRKERRARSAAARSPAGSPARSG